jgi:LmbE family N-acetylglucosaminyl deacetylase
MNAFGQGTASIIVVAHPDDEALWLSSVLGTARAVIFCYGDPYQRPKLAAARRRAVSALDQSGLLHGLTDLQIPESGAGFAVDWPLPALTPFGVAINEPAAQARYEANYPRLIAALRPALANCRNVYTHNPWGEYGHAEHLQVYRAVAALQTELGFTLRFSNYVSARSWQLAQQLADRINWSERVGRPTDKKLARQLMRIYANFGAWTWTRLHRWPRCETLYAYQPAASENRLAGESLLDTGRLRWWPPPFRNPRRRLG